MVYYPLTNDMWPSNEQNKSMHLQQCKTNNRTMHLAIRMGAKHTVSKQIMDLQSFDKIFRTDALTRVVCSKVLLEMEHPDPSWCLGHIQSFDDALTIYTHIKWIVMGKWWPCITNTPLTIMSVSTLCLSDIIVCLELFCLATTGVDLSLIHIWRCRRRG